MRCLSCTNQSTCWIDHIPYPSGRRMGCCVFVLFGIWVLRLLNVVGQYAAATLIRFNFVIRNCTIYLFHIHDCTHVHDLVRILSYHGEHRQKTNSHSLKHDETTWCTYVPVTWVMMGSDSGLSLPRCYAIIHNNDGSILIGRLVTDFNEIWINTQRCSYKKIYLNMSSLKWYHCVSVSMAWYLCYVYLRVSTYYGLRCGAYSR